MMRPLEKGHSPGSKTNQQRKSEREEGDTDIPHVSPDTSLKEDLKRKPGPPHKTEIHPASDQQLV